jgi:hypothetical protein
MPIFTPALRRHAAFSLSPRSDHFAAICAAMLFAYYFSAAFRR